MVRIESIYFKGKDERGVTGEISNENRQGPYILAYRKEGSRSGNHYHQGLSNLKNPEVLFLLQGRISLRYAPVNSSGEKGEEQTETVQAPARIEVSKWTWHEIEFLEDSCFFELNSFAEGDKDTFKTKEL